MEVGANPNDEDLLTPFTVNARRAIEVPANRYQFTDRFIALSSSRSRRLAFDARVSTGRYYDGDRQIMQAGINARLNTRLSGSLSLTRDTVDLTTGRATTHLVAARVHYGFSARAFLHALVQHDSNAHRWDTNVRFNFIHHPLSDLFVVLGERRDPGLGRTPDRSVTVKLTHLVNF